MDLILQQITALIVGILPNLPGFLTTIKVIPLEAFPLWVSHFYNYAWFVGFFVAGLVYYMMMRKYKIDELRNVKPLEFVGAIFID